jgi:uncharacterized secreted protein with C-terminal beta-propeller domain
MKTMRSTGWWLAGALALTACGGSPDFPKEGAIQKRIALQSFATCGDLEQYIEDTAVLQMKSQLEASRDQIANRSFEGVPAMAPDAANAGTVAAADSSGPSAYTTTNTQVKGVDEADFVKNDGTRIFVLSGNRLYINQSWPAAELKNVSSVEVEGYPTQMFLDEQSRIVIFSQVQSWELYDRLMYSPIACDGMYCGYYYSNSLKVTVVDVADAAAPKVTDQYYLPGQYNNARRVGASVRLVMNDNFRWPSTVQWYPQYQPGLYEDASLRAAAFNKLISDNEKLIRAQSLDQWLPKTKRKLADGSLQPMEHQCSDFQKVSAPTRLGLLTVATFNLDNPGAFTRTSIVAEAGEVYASTKNLYIANPHWWWWDAVGQGDWTYLHKFDITDPNKAIYVASGGVAGHIVDQFSMDEDATGYFRLATTISTRVPDVQNPRNTWGRLETTNRVTVMGENAGALEEVGRTEDLAPGERIFSARFMGPRAYVVTFRQVDPFFTIDLSNPAAPKKVGELKIPGFSTYLHPVDENHVLAIGTYQPENGSWTARSIKISLFDVTDFANPKETFSQLVGTAYSYSEAQYDHKAFNYFPEKKLLAIPFSDWNSSYSGDSYWTSFVSDLRVFHIDAATGITPKGALSMRDMYQVQQSYGWSYYWMPAVRRSVMADDFVYAISDAGLRVANIAALGSPLKTIHFVPYSTTK